MMLGGSLTETLHQRSSGNSLHAVSRVEDVQVALPQPKYPRFKQITGRKLGTLKPRLGHAGQRPAGQGRQFVTDCVHESSCRVAGPGSPLALAVGVVTFSAFWLWEGAVRTGHVPNALPSCR
jgi:hypothetical protein